MCSFFFLSILSLCCRLIITNLCFSFSKIELEFRAQDFVDHFNDDDCNGNDRMKKNKMNAPTRRTHKIQHTKKTHTEWRVKHGKKTNVCTSRTLLLLWIMKCTCLCGQHFDKENFFFSYFVKKGARSTQCNTEPIFKPIKRELNVEHVWKQTKSICSAGQKF